MTNPREDALRESPLGAAIRRAREGLNPVEAIRAFNEGKFEGDDSARLPFDLSNPPPYASDVSLWEPWGRDLYYSRNALAEEITEWEDLHESVRAGWCLAAHDYHRGPRP